MDGVRPQSYELVPAQSVQDTQFAIDQEPAPHAARLSFPISREGPKAAQEAKLASDMLFASTPVRLMGEIKGGARVEVILKDVYRTNDRIYVKICDPESGPISLSARHA